MADRIRLLQASAHDLAELPDRSVNLVATSPPYYRQRKYRGEQTVDWPAVSFPNPFGGPDVEIPAMSAELGQEPDLNGCRPSNAWDGHRAYIGHLILCLREWRRVLTDDGLVILNLGDGYAQKRQGPFKPKDLRLMPARVTMAAQADGWWLRNAVPWLSTNGMPDSPNDRLVVGHEDIFILAKSRRYFFDIEAIRREPAGYTRKGGSAPYSADGSANHGLGSSSLHQMAPDGRRCRTSDIWLDSAAAWAAWHERNAGYLRRFGRQPIAAAAGSGLAGFYVNKQQFRGEHYAPWPEELVRLFILAGTSAGGRCPTCHHQWKRSHIGGGWRPVCDCGDQTPERAVLLDPFAGSGATGCVGVALNRDVILADISREYLEDVMPKRLQQIRPLPGLFGRF